MPFFCNIIDEANLWKSKIERLAKRQISWEECFEASPEEICKTGEHPAFDIRTMREGHSLLHLAVYQNRVDWMQSLNTMPRLASCRNQYGLTPRELALFLGCGGFEQRAPYHPLYIPGVEYVSQIQFESGSTFDVILEKIAKAKSQDEISPEKIWMGVYFDTEIQMGYHPQVSLRWINPEIGYGIFAEQMIKSCAFVGEYAGVVRKRKKKSVKDNYYCIRYNFGEQDTSQFILDAEYKGNFTRCINHSKTPNVCLQSVYWKGFLRMTVIALRTIQRGEQLTLDYGLKFWKQCNKIPLVL